MIQPTNQKATQLITFVCAKFDDYQYPIQQASHHKYDHHGTVQGTNAGNNVTHGYRQMGANQGPVMGTPVTNQSSSKGSIDNCSPKQGIVVGIESDNDVVPETRREGDVCGTLEGSVWNTQSSKTVLGEADRKIEGMGV